MHKLLKPTFNGFIEVKASIFSSKAPLPTAVGGTSVGIPHVYIWLDNHVTAADAA
jgi:hypothetical protein